MEEAREITDKIGWTGMREINSIGEDRFGRKRYRAG
jgi:hypothetical protein